jgi:hypothetical protein
MRNQVKHFRLAVLSYFRNLFEVPSSKIWNEAGVCARFARRTSALTDVLCYMSVH